MRKELLSLAGGLLSAAVQSQNGEKKGRLENKTVEVEDKNFDYQIYVPANTETGQKLPLIVFLHGYLQSSGCRWRRSIMSYTTCFRWRGP